MVHDAEVARYNFVLQHGAGWNINPVPVVGDDDDGALRGRRESDEFSLCRSQTERAAGRHFQTGILIKAINQ